MLRKGLDSYILEVNSQSFVPYLLQFKIYKSSLKVGSIALIYLFGKFCDMQAGWRPFRKSPTAVNGNERLSLL